MKLTKFKDLKEGMKVTCEIHGEEITDAKISIDEEGNKFICQNKASGSGNKYAEKLGYKYGWSIAENLEVLKDLSVTNLTSSRRTMEECRDGHATSRSDTWPKKCIRCGTMVKESNSTPLKKEEPIRWRAEEGYGFWFLDVDGKCVNRRECDHEYDKSRWDIGNYFPSKQQAEFYKLRLESMLEMAGIFIDCSSREFISIYIPDKYKEAWETPLYDETLFKDE